MDGIRSALSGDTVVENSAETSTGMPRHLTLGLLLVLVAFGASGCADQFCGFAKSDSAVPSCPTHGPMPPTYFPALTRWGLDMAR
jgi:hypothetical protein